VKRLEPLFEVVALGDRREEEMLDAARGELVGPRPARLHGADKVLGPRRALELAFTGKTLDAEEALAWGLVNGVVDDGALHAETEALAKKVAAGPSRAFGAIKRLVHSGFVEAMESHMEREARTLAEVTTTADATFVVDAGATDLFHTNAATSPVHRRRTGISLMPATKFDRMRRIGPHGAAFG
jgi:hypothetical protein